MEDIPPTSYLKLGKDHGLGCHTKNLEIELIFK